MVRKSLVDYFYMKTHRIFPTVLTEFSYDISSEEESTVHREFDKFKYHPDVFPINTIDDLHVHIPDSLQSILLIYLILY